MASFLITKRDGQALTMGEVDAGEAEVVEAGMEGVEVVVPNMGQDLQAVIEAVRDLPLAGEIHPGRHLRARGVAVIVDVVARVVGIEWMILPRIWRR